MSRLRVPSGDGAQLGRATVRVQCPIVCSGRQASLAAAFPPGLREATQGK